MDKTIFDEVALEVLDVLHQIDIQNFSVSEMSRRRDQLFERSDKYSPDDYVSMMKDRVEMSVLGVLRMKHLIERGDYDED